MSIAGHLGELVGYKAGLALTRSELSEHLSDSPDIRGIVASSENRLVRVRSEEYEAAVSGLLFSVGNIPTPRPLPPILAVFRRFEHDQAYDEILEEVLTRSVELLKDEASNTSRGASLDSSRLLLAVATEFGRPGVDIAVALFEALALQQQTSPWVRKRWFQWNDTAHLRDLFLSEGLETQYGTFLDQRFIDYLARNFRRIDEIHWRKFEGLAGEFFVRAGFRVEMGPGRGDDGVDVRVWSPGDNLANPPLVIVQCKRQRRRVGQVVVKALGRMSPAKGHGRGLSSPQVHWHQVLRLFGRLVLTRSLQ